MNNTPKISIIVPVYNVEKYVRQCIDSILSQSFTDFELLLINDGSKDKSGDICDEYAAEDSRIRVIHKENGGVSSARNVGLDNAHGEWIAFVDGDDEIQDGYLNIREGFENSDVIQKPYIIVRNNKEINISVQDTNVLRNKDSIYRYYVQKRNNALWDKLIKRSIIGNERFNTIVSIGEDFLFFLCILPKVKAWAFDNTGAYRYFVREGSAMQSVDLSKRIKILWENVGHVQELTSTDDLQVLQKCIVYKSYVILLYKYRNKLDKDELKKLKLLFREMKISQLKYIEFSTKRKLFFYKLQLKLKIGIK